MIILQVECFSFFMMIAINAISTIINKSHTYRSMVELLVDEGATLDQTDHHGNNVFHYISDLAIDDPDRAIRSYRFLKSVYPDMKVFLHNYFQITSDNLTPLS